MKKLLSVFLVSVLLLSLASAPAHAAQEPYTDLPADGWAREAILSARELGLMDGMGDGTFGVGRTMSRAQFVTVLARMFRLSPDGRGTPTAISPKAGPGTPSTPAPSRASRTAPTASSPTGPSPGGRCPCGWSGPWATPISRS